MQCLETLHLSNTKRTLSNVPAILETLPNLAGKRRKFVARFLLERSNFRSRLVSERSVGGAGRRLQMQSVETFEFER